MQPPTTYDLGFDAPPGEPSTLNTPPSTHLVHAVANQAAIRFPCPTCGRRLRATSDTGGKPITCPECGEKLRVPDFGGNGETPAGEEPPPKARTKKRKRSTPGLPPVVRKEKEEPPIEPPVVPTVFDRLAEYRVEEPDPPPQWTFLSDVFDLPWLPGAMIRFVWLTLGMTFVCLMGSLILLLSGAVSEGGFTGHGVAVGVAFLLLPTFWVGFFTCSFLAACCTAIVEHTAAGRRNIDQWPEGSWRDWAGEMIPLVYLLLLTGAIGWSVGQAVEPQWRVPAIGLVIVVLYPFLWLSALETGNVWIPFSPVVTFSLFPLWWAWLAFYALAGLLTVGVAAFYWYGAIHNRAVFQTALLTAPLLTYALLVDARLLGRMAWKIGDRGR